MLAVGLSYSEIGKRLSSCANMGNVNTGPTEVPRPRDGARSGLPLKFVAQALESVVERGLEGFLKVGAALAELRAKRLYRCEFGTFESYVQNRFGLHRARVDVLIRSSSVAQSLLDNGINLPPDTDEATIRPLCGLPDEDDLKAATWEFIQTLAPEHATGTIVARVCRVVRNALEGADESPDSQPSQDSQSFVRSGPRKARSVQSPQREKPCTGAVTRLANWSGFSVEIIVSNVNQMPSASNLYRVCGTMIERCQLVRETGNTLGRGSTSLEDLRLTKRFRRFS